MIKSLKKQTFAVEVTEGEKLELDCKFDEPMPSAKIIWSFNENSKLDAKHETSADRLRLSLFDVSREQTGAYECSARMNEQDYLTRHEVTVKERQLTREFKQKFVRLNESDDSVVLDCTWWWLIDSFNNYLLDEKNLAVWTLNDDAEIKDGANSEDGRTFEFLDNHNTLLKISGLSVAKDNSTNFTCSFKLSKQATLKTSQFTLNFSGKCCVVARVVS